MRKGKGRKPEFYSWSSEQDKTEFVDRRRHDMIPRDHERRTSFLCNARPHPLGALSPANIELKKGIRGSQCQRTHVRRGFESQARVTVRLIFHSLFHPCILVTGHLPTQVSENMDRQWTEEECLALVQLYRSRDILWDPKHSSHYKRNLKDDAWNEISAATGRTVDQLKSKMLSLLASYRREKCKIAKSNAPGKDPTEAYTSRWFAYEAMCFLEQRPPKRRASTENFEGSYVDEELIYTEGSEEGNPEELRFEQTLITPNSYKRMKREEHKTEENPKESAVKMGHVLPENDEVTAFFNYVTTKVRNYSLITWRGVERDIFDVLVKADRGHYE